MVTAISQLRALSSTTSSRFPAKAAAFSDGSACSSMRNGSASTRRSSDRNSGFAQKAVTPAARASISMSVQS